MPLEPEDKILRGREEMAEFLEIHVNTLDRYRKKYKDINPCPTVRVTKGRVPTRYVILLTRKSLLFRWYFQIMTEEEEQRDKRKGRPISP